MRFKALGTSKAAAEKEKKLDGSRNCAESAINGRLDFETPQLESGHCPRQPQLFTSCSATVTMSNYTVPPPSYQGQPAASKPGYPANDEASSPLLGAQASSSRGGAIYDQPGHGDLPDDFKVRS